MGRAIAALASLLLLISTFSVADPSSLAPWEAWIAKDHPQLDCPWRYDQKNQQMCIWPGNLDLSLSKRGMSFSLDIHVYSDEAMVTIPGDAKNWPLSVRVDGRPAALVEKNKLPHISLPYGNHRISGEFKWSKKPGQLAVPASIALISLRDNGRVQEIDRRRNQLIFSRRDQPLLKQSRDNLNIEVYRKISDGVPMVMVSQIKLFVSGKPREITVGKAVMANSELVSLQSALPARVETNGDMLVQLRPGEHIVYITTRFLDRGLSIKRLLPSTENWPINEYVSFDANTDIRQVKLSGAVSVDTSQIAMPRQWADLPTYQLGKDTELTIREESRGDYAPSANELAIVRNLWLDFDGSGLTSLDKINGRMYQGWRLSAAEGSRIGRATVDGKAVLITEHEQTQGIEIRSLAIDLEAVTRIDSISDFSAMGWMARAEKYRTTLHLPPGWRVLHATGLDGISGTWVSRWDLWDVFLMLVIVAATRKLFNIFVAILAGAAFVLGLHEPGSPLLIIPAILVIIALLPITSPRLKRALSSLGIMLSAALVITFLSFAVDSFRLAIYPSLERHTVGEYRPLYNSRLSSDASIQEMQISLERPMELKRSTSSVGDLALPAKSKRERQQFKDNLYQVAENDRVQTGPGLPTWTWRAVSLRSSGPVGSEQQLAIRYSPPWLTALWRVSAVILVGIYAGLILQQFAKLLRLRPQSTQSATGALIVVVMLAGLMTPPVSEAQEFPPEYLLRELEETLLEPPQCLPDCVGLNNAHLSIKASTLTLNFDAFADTDIALPLPNARDNWQLLDVMERGKMLPLSRDARGLYVHITKGHHKLRLRAKIRVGESVAINFPQPIHNFEFSATDWVADGLIDGRIRSNTLNLRAVGELETSDVDTLKPNTITNFVSVKRVFEFGKQWRVNTTVTRIAPLQGAMSVAIPLLNDEKLLSDIGAISNGVAAIQFGHRQQLVRWSSTMEPSALMELEAGDGNTYIEEWQFSPSSLWRLTYRGFPPTKTSHRTGSLRPTFKPWPGESLSIDASRPEGVSGPTYTVEDSTLDYIAGKQIQKSVLTLNIRSTLGSDYKIQLPTNAEVLSVAVDDRAMNLPSENTVTIPLQPGLQTVVVEFQQLQELGLFDVSPTVLLPGGAANIKINYTLASDRWPLYLNGPSIGPAMLYWGVLVVIVLSAFALSYMSGALHLNMPINLLGWLLLGIGLSTVNAYGVLVVALFFFAFAARAQHLNPGSVSRRRYNVIQVLLVLLSIFAALSIISAVPMGLLSNPEMKVVGNGSNSHLFRYYQDSAATGQFPVVTVLSVPIFAYRIVMLLWSLWLATKVIQWASWAWKCYTEKLIWIPKANSSKKLET